MSNVEAPLNTPVWVNESRCKACDRCVSVCPAGVLGMRQDIHSTLGSMATVIHPEVCIDAMIVNYLALILLFLSLIKRV